MFELHVALSGDCESLLLSPGEADFVNGVDVVLEGFIETCHVVERMLENEDLVCGVVEEEGLEVQTAMKDLILDEEYEGHKAAAMQLLSTSYQNVVAFVGTYHPFRYGPHAGCVHKLRVKAESKEHRGLKWEHLHLGGLHTVVGVVALLYCLEFLFALEICAALPNAGSV
jgi:hypothetical protein